MNMVVIWIALLSQHIPGKTKEDHIKKYNPKEIQSPDQNSNMWPPEYEAREITTQLIC
jgi:hypothetical protein